MRGIFGRLRGRSGSEPESGVEWLDVGELRRRLGATPAPLMVDVRGPDEFDGPLGHIEGSRNIPLDRLTEHLPELAAAGRPAVFVCLTDKRSLRAAAQCAAAGIADVAVLRGGMQAWNREPPMPLRLTICGVGDLADHGAAGVTHILSILDPETPQPAAYAGFAPHQRLDLRFHDVVDPAPGWLAPAAEDVARFLAFARDLALPELPEREPHLLVHCYAGVSRSTAAALLILAQAAPERPAAELLAAVVRQRPRAWPNLLLLELGDGLLGRRGEIVAAVAAHYRTRLDEDPYLAREIQATGRGREVAVARGL